MTFTKQQVVEALRHFASRNEKSETDFKPHQILAWHLAQLDAPAQVTNFCANCEATERHSAALQAERDKAQADAAALRRFLIASIRQLGDPAFLITYQSGKQLVAEIRRAMAAQLEAPHPGESLLAELTAARTEVTTLKQAIQRYQSACEREIRASVQEMLQSGEEISNDIGDAAEVMFSLVSKEAQ